MDFSVLLEDQVNNMAVFWTGCLSIYGTLDLFY